MKKSYEQLCASVSVSEVLTAAIIRARAKAVPLHAMEALGGEEV
jgi:hypothetical protein